LKFDRDLHVRRVGTPVQNMNDVDIPSPPPQKSSRSMALLPCEGVFS